VRRFGKVLGRVLLGLLIAVAAIWFFWPREPVDTEIAFDARILPDNLDVYLETAEARFDDITPGVEKRVVWAGAPGTQTDIALVYIHGYSATSEEIRPVPDMVAKALGANLYYARLKGHGRDGLAMTEASAGDWLEDTAEALAIGQRIGKEVAPWRERDDLCLSQFPDKEPDLDHSGMAAGPHDLYPFGGGGTQLGSAKRGAWQVLDDALSHHRADPHGCGGQICP